jgi:hypothetical protein
MTTETQQISIQIPAVYTGASNGVDWAVNLAETPADALAHVVESLVDQGITIILQRVKSGDSEADRKAAVPVKAAAIQAGTYSFGQGGGGGGARKTVEQEAWIQYFTTPDPETKKLQVTFADKRKCNTKTLEDFQRVLTRKAIWPLVQAKLAEMSEEEQRQYHKERLPEIIEKNLPKVIAREEARTEKGTVGWLIQQEKARRAGKKVSKPEVETLEDAEV